MTTLGGWNVMVMVMVLMMMTMMMLLLLLHEDCRQKDMPHLATSLEAGMPAVLVIRLPDHCWAIWAKLQMSLDVSLTIIDFMPQHYVCFFLEDLRVLSDSVV